MANEVGGTNGAQAASSDSGKWSLTQAPAITLPKGGGAIQGIGEKFGANPVNGTASMTVPIFASPGRSGFGPQLTLSYDSGAGNGPFGLGWSLGIPSITRATAKGIPQYRDHDESDVFLLAGAEDLVPFLVPATGGTWVRDSTSRNANGLQYRIDRYRPRIEGTFALIERWTRADTGDTHWRTVSPNNVTTIFGADATSRIADPADPTRVFGWLVARTFDDKGNVAVYAYRSEDFADVDVSALHERNRSHRAPGPQRYLDRILYGNAGPFLPDLSAVPATPLPTEWLFELAFDYGNHRGAGPTPTANATWRARPDPFSTYRAGFEIRTHRLCERVLMFHRFAELGTQPCLVRSTDFTYQRGGDGTDPSELPFSFLSSAHQTAYKYDAAQPGGYRSASTPPVEFSYSRAAIGSEIKLLDPSALENLPVGLTGPGYQWVDLNGEGLSGVLTEQGGAWYYKANLGGGQFDRTTVIARQSSIAALAGGRQQLMDLAGDGQLDLVDFSGAVPGLHERSEDDGWSPFAPFASLPRIDWSDANLRFVDLTGDGLADALVTEHDVFTWYGSLGEDGFTAANRTRKPLDESQGPRVVFADGTQTVFVADMSGDGLADIVRIRNGEVCYWPNLGYGHFGAQVTLDHAPWFDHPEAYDPRRIRLADVDGSGPTDILYLGADGARLYVNRSGNALSDPRTLPFPVSTDNLAAVQVADLFGNGTACLIWSSALPADARNPVRYLDLMRGQKPHLLTGVKNNLGAETTVGYAPSTKFYVRDKQAGRPWLTRLPFPVHCVERVTVTDKWRASTFSTTYSYHHGFFDPIEREFRGFARVEQLDVESFGTFAAANLESPYVSANRTLYQPPIKTITWFHTGALSDRSGISLLGEYFPQSLAAERAVVPLAPGFAENPPALPAMPDGLDGDEWREAARACKGIVLRQEAYELDVDALDPSAGTPPRHVAVRLFSATTRNSQVRRVQPRAKNRYGVFLVSEREALTYQYELDLRDLTLPPPGAARLPLTPDPRVTHTLNLSFDDYGQAQQTVAVGYSRWRLFDDPDAALQTLVRDVQGERHLAYVETRYTSDAIDPAAGGVPIQFYRLPASCESLSYELTGITLPAGRLYFSAADFLAFDLSDRYRVPGTLQPIARRKYHERPPTTAAMRLVEHARTRFFRDDPADTARFLSEPLDLGTLGRLGLIYEQYKLALTTSLLEAVFTPAQLAQPTRPGATVASDLRAQGRAGYVSGTVFYPVPPPAAMPADAPDEYWMRSGVAGFDTTAAQHFFLPTRYTDPFGNVSLVTYDTRDLFVASATDAAHNPTRVTRFDYRVLAPVEMEDINANLTEAYFDVLGRVVALAIKGKGTEADDLVGFTDDVANPGVTDLEALFRVAPDRQTARRLLGHATMRFVPHFGDAAGVWAVRPPGACHIVREEHGANVARRRQADPNAESLLQLSFECSDGLGTVLMTRGQAEPAAAGEPERWIVSGKTVLNNKGKPVKQYEPYFSHTAVCRAEGAPQEEVGVTPLLYYDAAGRLVRTELPDGTLNRVVFSPWHIATYDANDTVKESAWYTSRNPLPPQAAIPRDPMTGELLCTPAQRAAWLSAHHADTPSLSILDSLGRAVVAMRHNRVQDPAGTITLGGIAYRDERDITYTKLDAEGKALWIRDARRNLVMQYITPTKAARWSDEPNEAVPAGSVPAYDVAGHLLFQHSMDAGDRWMINDAAGKPLFAWDSRGQLIVSSYDALRRPTTVELISPSHTSPIVVALTQYAERTAADIQNNRCGTAWRVFDQSGAVTSVAFDFKGNATQATRRLADDYDADTDWRSVEALSRTAEPDAQLMGETFTRIASYDALNRMTLLYNWHRAGQPVSVYELSYGQRGLLDNETLTVGATKTATGHTGGAATTVITSQTHDAKGQRLRLALGNGVVTSYDYDPETYRLLRLRSRRANNEVLQDLQYTYDAVGNIVELRDDAKPREFFDNAAIEPRRRYVYDALNRLIEASGREHAGQANVGANDNWNDCPFRVDYGAANVKAWRNYTQRFTYDVVGNILEMRHLVANSTARSWTRQYEYATDSNRLLATETGAAPVATHYPAGAPTLATTYQYNAHGSLSSLSHLPQMEWNFTEHLSHVSRSAGSTGTDPDGCPDSSMDAWYRYTVAKQRSRKRVVKQGGIVEDRVYLDGLEWYRRTANGTLSDEVETLHVLDGQARVLMVDQVRPPGGAASTLYRFTLSDHLGSSTVEVNENADAISFEEYHPYGTTAYQSGPNAGEVKRKRYRYTGMERDEESGLSYHTARYYSAVLCRWTSCDPSGLKGGVNVFSYVNCDPVSGRDPGGRQKESAVGAEELPKTADEMLDLASEVYHSGQPGSIARSRELSRLGHQMVVKEAMDITHKTRDEGAKMSNTVMAVLLAPLAIGITAAAVVETTAVASVIAVARALLAAARGIWLVWRFYIGGMSVGIKQTYEALVRNGVSVQSVISAINTAGANPQVRGTLEMGAQAVIDAGGPIDPVHGSIVSAPAAAVKEEVNEEVKAVIAAAPAATKKVAATTSEIFGTLAQMRDEEVAMVKQLYPEMMLAGKPTPDLRGASWATWFGNILNERMRRRVLAAQAEGTLTQSLMMTRQGQKGIDFWLPNGIGFDLFPATEAGMISHMDKFENVLAPDGKTTITEMMALLYFRDK